MSSATTALILHSLKGESATCLHDGGTDTDPKPRKMMRPNSGSSHQTCAPPSEDLESALSGFNSGSPSPSSLRVEVRSQEPQPRRTQTIYVLFLIAYLAVQFGHGANIGLATSLKGDSKAMNLALGSWVMVGVSLGLPVTPWACRNFGTLRVCKVCAVIDLAVILMMLIPGISLHQIYLIRFLVGFFEAPFLPYLQEWLAVHGKSTWNVWNTILHAMVPLGENLGFLIAKELVHLDYGWQSAFAGQAVAFALSAGLCYIYGRGKYLEVAKPERCTDLADPTPVNFEFEHVDQGDEGQSEVEYPATERWCLYWATNVALAAQLAFFSGCKYVISDYAKERQFHPQVTMLVFTAIALLGPAIGGAVAMSGGIIRPDKWSHHRKTLAFLVGCSSLAACIVVFLPYVPSTLFWPMLLLSFVAAGGVYPAAQGIINISLTSSRVMDASIYQVQCNNILFAMPMPWVIGKTMDNFSIGHSFVLVTCLQVLAAAAFMFALVVASLTERRNAWHRIGGTGADADDNQTLPFFSPKKRLGTWNGRSHDVELGFGAAGDNRGCAQDSEKQRLVFGMEP